MEPQLIKRLLLARVFELRRNQFRYESLDKPQSVQTDTIQTPEGPRARRRIVLTAHGCSVATCTMCPLPDEAVDSHTPVTLDNWMAQLRAGIKVNEGIRQFNPIHTLTLFHNGNFFAEREVPETWRMQIYDYLRTTGIKELVVECLPQYLNEGSLRRARLGLRDIKLSVAIGLQSSSPLVRELCISSTCMGNTFRNAVELLHGQGDDAQAFLMFHPPFLTIPESIWDLRESIRFVHECGVVPTVCPMRIAPNTVVADLAAKGLYQVPDMWYLYDALEGVKDNVRVATSLLTEQMPAVLIEAFSAFNTSGLLPDLGSWSMRPQPGVVPTEPDRAAVLRRIEEYLRLCA